MKKQASNLFKLAIIAGFMTGAAAQADDHAAKGHDAAAPKAEAEKKAKAAKEVAPAATAADQAGKPAADHAAHAGKPAPAPTKKH